MSRMSRVVVNCLAAVAAGGCFLMSGGSAWAAGPIAWAAPFTIDATSYGFAALSCPSASLCVGVARASGNLVSSTSPAAGASAWKERVVIAAGAGVAMRDVSCPSTALCVAIDHGGDVVTSTDPGAPSPTWSISHVDSDTAGADVLVAVDCPTVSLCVATDVQGNVVTSTDPTGGPGAWTVKHIDDTTRYCKDINGPCGVPAISVISCATATSCVALDTYGAILSSSDPTGQWQGGEGGADYGDGGHYDPLSELACPSTSLCVAAQDYGSGIFTSESDFAIGVPVGSSASLGLWCASVSLCFYAAGIDNAFGAALYVATNPTGPASAWMLSDSRASGIDSISCPTTSLCFAGDAAGEVLVGRPAPTVEQIRTAIRRQVAPRGADARIGAVRRRRGYTDTVKAPEAGEVQISWYLPVTTGRRPHRHTVAKLIADGTARFDAQRTHTVQINLNAAGRRLLNTKRRVHLTTRARFTPLGGSVVATTETSTLTR